MIRILVPAVVFQSVMFGGAYGSGREVVEYFSRFGELRGIAGVFTAAVVFSLVVSLSLDIARRASVFEYRQFLGLIAGRGWILFELLFLAMLLLVLAVNLAAGTEMLDLHWQVSRSVSSTLMVALIVMLIILGRRTIQGFMWLGSLLLMGLMITLPFLTPEFTVDSPGATTAPAETAVPAILSGARYALYNLICVPVLLYCARDLRTQGECILAGSLAGTAVVFPALLLHTAFSEGSPELLASSLPAIEWVAASGRPNFQAMYALVFFTMIINTLSGLLLGLNERIDAASPTKSGSGPSLRHGLVTLLVLALSALLARLGVIPLVAKGYGSVAWLVLPVFVLPLLWRFLTTLQPLAPLYQQTENADS